MFYQIKAIRKNSKPPIWRRILIPSGITFSQMAVILEEVLEIPLLETFEFEFYTKKERLAEYREGNRLPADFYYSAYDAAETFVNDYLDKEKWFTFRILDMEQIPEYRLEIEKLVVKATVSNPGAGKGREVQSPIIVKEVSMENDPFFTDAYAINEELGKSYYLVEGENSFAGHTQTASRIQSGKGIVYSRNPVSGKSHVEPSVNSYLQEMADKIQMLHDNGSAADRGYIADTLNSITNRRNDGADLSESEETPRHTSLSAFLATYSLEDLMDVAKDIHYQTTEKNRKKLAKELAEKLLLPETMKKQLFWTTEEELDTFEDVIKKQGVFCTDEDWDKYENIYDRNYYIAYEDGYVGVTVGIAHAYETISQGDYRKIRKQARWLYKCLSYARFIHVVIPLKQLYRIFKQKDGMDIGIDALKPLFDEIPSEYLPCVLHGDKVIAKEVVKNDLYKNIEKGMRDVGYYIPSEDNIEAFMKEYYPADDPAYKKLYEYYTRGLGWDEDISAEMCHMAAKIFPMNDSISDYVDILKEHGLSLRSEKDVETFSKLIIAVHNNTRMFCFRGHTPEEMAHLFPPDIKEFPTIVPMSTEAANFLNAGKNEMEKMGFKVDTESDATKLQSAVFPQGMGGNVVPMTKKVYPNDPCPCGSGKKFKKCCGRKA